MSEQETNQEITNAENEEKHSKKATEKEMIDVFLENKEGKKQEKKENWKKAENKVLVEEKRYKRN